MRTIRGERARGTLFRSAVDEMRRTAVPMMARGDSDALVPTTRSRLSLPRYGNETVLR
jgi:hypothetical protein